MTGNGAVVRHAGACFTQCVYKAPARLLLQNAYNETVVVTARQLRRGWRCGVALTCAFLWLPVVGFAALAWKRGRVVAPQLTAGILKA